ncbi:alpha/beta fold hydrolase [Phenylobacterium sp.]|uniref:alpha/beta fold hydrolase n=1 Tax=Phenylobacterium sp. TaxID=1871053 RepID=UPI0035B2C41A
MKPPAREFEADRFFALWAELERDVADNRAPQLDGLHDAGNESLACRPAAPEAGFAAAVIHGGSLAWAGGGWTDLFGVGAPAIPPATAHAARSGRAYLVLEDRRGRAVLAVLAARRHSAAWPVAGALANAPGDSALVAMVFAPSRMRGFADFAARVYGLGRSEHELLDQLMQADDLDAIAERLSLSEAAVRKRVRRLLKSTGADRRGALLARLTRLLADESVCDWARDVGLRRALGATPAQMRLSHLLAEGATLPHAAETLGLSTHTVRDQAREILARTGQKRLAELPRFLAEARALVAFAEADETACSDREGLLGATRIFYLARRQVAAADFGPPDGEPVLFVHGGMGSRRVATRLRAALQARGLRPLGVDRPGFGLTDPAGGDPFVAAAGDMAGLLDALGLERVRLLARDGGAPAALAFAALHPERVQAGVLISPRPPRARLPGVQLIDGWIRLGAQHPSAIVAIYALLRRKAGVRLTETLIRRLFGGHSADAALIEDPVWRHAAVAELLTCGARTADGLAAEQTAYPRWRPPLLAGPAPWTVVTGGLDPLWAAAAQEDPWRGLPGLRHVRIAEAGRFLQDTHAEEIAVLVSKAGMRAAPPL